MLLHFKLFYSHPLIMLLCYLFIQFLLTVVYIKSKYKNFKYFIAWIRILIL